MINTKFEAYKITRELKRSGIEYKFTRNKKNKFGENIDGGESIGKLQGIYHEQSSYVKTTTSEAAQTRTKKIPMILCLYEDTASLQLQKGDIVKINSKTFKVKGVTNIQEWNIISDISLEVEDNGVHA